MQAAFHKLLRRQLQVGLAQLDPPACDTGPAFGGQDSRLQLETLPPALEHGSTLLALPGHHSPAWAATLIAGRLQGHRLVAAATSATCCSHMQFDTVLGLPRQMRAACKCAALWQQPYLPQAAVRVLRAELGLPRPLRAGCKCSALWQQPHGPHAAAACPEPDQRSAQQPAASSCTDRRGLQGRAVRTTPPLQTSTSDTVLGRSNFRWTGPRWRWCSLPP